MAAGRAIDPARTVLVYLFRCTGDEPEVLLLKRVDRAGLKGFWQGVSGRCEVGESHAQAAAREVEEETRLHPEVQDTGYSYTFASTEHPELAIQETVFYAFTSEDPQLSWEHSDFRWCSFAEAMTMLFWPGNKVALQKTYDLVDERHN